MMVLPRIKLGSVLIVDDEPDICLLLKNILIKMSLKVDYAYTIEKGLEKVVEETPEVVFLDMNLSDGNGLDYIAAFKQNKKPASIVMISAYDTAADRSKAKALGVNYFLSKPFTQNQISEVILNLTKDSQKLNNGKNINN